MKRSEFKNHLKNTSEVNFIQPNGHFVPRHFHITEAGLTTKHFVDCGGTLRSEKVLNLQVLVANDTAHRLGSEKLQRIIAISEKHFGIEDLEVEIEYQTDTIGRYSLDIKGENFQLVAKHTDCLASNHCGIANYEKTTEELAAACCGSNGTCC